MCAPSQRFDLLLFVHVLRPDCVDAIDLYDCSVCAVASVEDLFFSVMYVLLRFERQPTQGAGGNMIIRTSGSFIYLTEKSH